MLNPGDTIWLEGVFNFGENQFISIKKSIAIKGLRGPDGEDLTIVKGGRNTFSLGWDPASGFPEYNKEIELL